ncbi:DUF806 family protein [Jeotgalibaca porci]|uniref:DUF806 family protein n=1 Tax=Jeotgalibaca porci TaxID=1868793 RepID=UPI00359F3363
MSASLDLKTLIESFKYPEVDSIYTIMVPIEEQDNTETNDILITEAIMENSDYSNDTFNSITQTLEMQVFYALHVEYDTEEFEIKLMKDLEKYGWLAVRTDPHIIDPDTYQTVKLFYFQRVKYL